MLQVRAIKSFQSRYGFVRAGAIFTSEPSYADELLRIGLIEMVQPKPQPQRVQAFAQAPRIAGKALTTTDAPPLSSPPSSAAPQESGPARPSSVLRRGLRRVGRT